MFLTLLEYISKLNMFNKVDAFLTINAYSMVWLIYRTITNDQLSFWLIKQRRKNSHLKYWLSEKWKGWKIVSIGTWNILSGVCMLLALGVIWTLQVTYPVANLEDANYVKKIPKPVFSDIFFFLFCLPQSELHGGT